MGWSGPHASRMDRPRFSRGNRSLRPSLLSLLGMVPERAGTGRELSKGHFRHTQPQVELRLGSSAQFVPTRNVFALGYLAMDASLRLEYLGRPFHYPDNLTITGPTEGEALCAKHEIPTCSDHTGRREYI